MIVTIDIPDSDIRLAISAELAGAWTTGGFPVKLGGHIKQLIAVEIERQTANLNLGPLVRTYLNSHLESDIAVQVKECIEGRIRATVKRTVPTPQLEKIVRSCLREVGKLPAITDEVPT